jgi:iron complex transport system ATP-binding protein
VFDDVSFSIPSEKITVFLGANGSGKTTMQKLILGLLKPETGEICLDNKPINHYDLQGLSKVIGWVPQVEEPSFPYTVKEYLAFGRAPHLGFFSSPDLRDGEVIKQVLDRFGLSEFTDREITRMSGGEKRMVFISRALVQEPRVLLLDEPTIHLDPANRLSVLSLLKDFGDAGNTVVFSTHDPNEAIHIADHAVLFTGREILACGSVRDVLSVENLNKVYGVDLKLLKIDDHFFVDF